MKHKTLTQAAQDMLDAVKALATAQGIDWTDPAFAPVALAHATLTDALTKQTQFEDVVANALGNQVVGNRTLSEDLARNPADRLYFRAGLDTADIVARKIAESGLVAREAFLNKCGCVA